MLNHISVLRCQSFEMTFECFVSKINFKIRCFGRISNRTPTEVKFENMLWPEVIFVTLFYHDDYKLRAPYRSLKSLNCQVVNS